MQAAPIQSEFTGRYNDECDDQLVKKRAEWRQQSHQARQGASPVRDQNIKAATKAAGNAERCFEQLCDH